LRAFVLRSQALPSDALLQAAPLLRQSLRAELRL
jgi:hypothetical protein